MDAAEAAAAAGRRAAERLAQKRHRRMAELGELEIDLASMLLTMQPWQGYDVAFLRV